MNLQFSIQNGKIGIDWVLLSPINIKDEHVFLDEAGKQACIVERNQENDVNYLRSESKNMVALCLALLDHYQVSPEDEMELIVESFDWKGNA
ncbi:MAG: hypothetical protein Q9M92_04610 [Enterobacterales bacterium]|nr:hypothetical protein [Enterobacterales bacterium]